MSPIDLLWLAITNTALQPVVCRRLPAEQIEGCSERRGGHRVASTGRHG